MSKKRKRIEERSVKTLYFNDLTGEEMERLEEFARSVDMRRKRDAAKMSAPRAEKEIVCKEWKEPESKLVENLRKYLKEEDEKSKSVDPDHYKSVLGVECSELMKDRLGEDCYLGFCLCNALKYLFRCRHKNPTLSDDVRKAQWYLSSAVSLIDKAESHAH